MTAPGHRRLSHDILPAERLLLRAAVGPGALAARSWAELAEIPGAAQVVESQAYSLIPQLFLNLHGLAVEGPLFPRLRGIYRRAWYEDQMLLAAAARAVQVLGRAGAFPIVLGRAACIACGVHGPGARPLDRVELLLAPSEAAGAIDSLMAAGWALESAMTTPLSRAASSPENSTVPGSRAARWRFGVDMRLGSSGKLHVRWAFGSAPAQSRRLRSEAVPARLGGTEVRVVPPSSSLVLLARRARGVLAGPRGPSPTSPVQWVPDAVLLLRAAVSRDGVGGPGLGELVVGARRARCALALADLVDLVDVLVPGVVPEPVGLARELRQAEAPGERVWCHLAPGAQRLGKSLATNEAAVAVVRAGAAAALRLLPEASRAGPSGTGGLPGSAPGQSPPGRALVPGRLDVRRLERFQRLALDAALAEITATFCAEGIRSLLLKGAAFAGWLYDDPSERSYGDIDLLVAPDDFEEARQALLRLGFNQVVAHWRGDEHASHQEKLVRAGTLPVVVELHHSLALLTARPSKVWGALTAGAVDIEVAGTIVKTTGNTASALVVGLHAAQHVGDDWCSPLNDLEHAVDRVGQGTWAEAAALAAELGGGAAFATGLRLSEKGRIIADELGLDRQLPALVQLRAAGAAPPTALGIDRLVRTAGVRGRLRLVVSELAPSRRFMSDKYWLARKGELGMWACYMWRPLELAWLLPRGFAAWRKAASPKSLG